MGDCHRLYFIMQHLSCLMSFSLHIKEFSAHLSLATVCNLPTEKKDRRLKCAYSVFLTSTMNYLKCGNTIETTNDVQFTISFFVYNVSSRWQNTAAVHSNVNSF